MHNQAAHKPKRDTQNGFSTSRLAFSENCWVVVNNDCKHFVYPSASESLSSKVPRADQTTSLFRDPRGILINIQVEEEKLHRQQRIVRNRARRSRHLIHPSERRALHRGHRRDLSFEDWLYLIGGLDSLRRNQPTQEFVELRFVAET